MQGEEHEKGVSSLLLGGYGGGLPRNILNVWCNLVSSGEFWSGFYDFSKHCMPHDNLPPLKLLN